MELDRVPEPVAVAEAAGHSFDALSLCVDRFAARVRRSEHDGVDDTVEVFAHHALAARVREPPRVA